MNEAGATVAPSTLTIENVQLERFEALVRERKYQRAGQELLYTLQRLKQGAGFAGHPNTDESRPALYTRLAAAMTALLADPDFPLSRENFDRLAVEHATLHAVFAASRFENADPLLHRLGEPDPEDPTRLVCCSSQNILKLLLAYSSESAHELDFEPLFRTAPRRTLACFLGMLAHKIVFSAAAHRWRERLLALGPLFEGADVEDCMLDAMRDAWMYCSYAQGEHKHDIKRSLNVMVRRLVESRSELPELPKPRRLKPRPTILLPVEWFTSPHAMYRSYAPSVRKLRNRFRLVAICSPIAIDTVSKDLFDEVIEITGSHPALAAIVSDVQRLAPDMIYYPSLGMAWWCVALATVRLAPIQCYTLGHPATTHSPAVDYALVPELVPGDPSCFAETVVLTRRLASMAMRKDATFPEPELRRSPELLRIAVPSMASKLTAPFLSVCQNLNRRSRRALEFHFFPNEVGLTLFHAAREIRKWVPGALVHGRYDYGAYLRALSACDVHLSTFPFGGTNSNIDSMRLGVPLVTLEGLETHSQTDAAMLRAAGMPESLIARDAAEFEDIALRLIENDRERCALAQQLLGTDIDAIFLDQGDDEGSVDFLEAMWWLYSHHERIQASQIRYWTVDGRREIA